MLEARNISKRFAGVAALSQVNLKLFAGRVNAIVGENGAGKSTLMKIFSGVYPHYEGEIVYNDAVVRFQNPREAEEAGIAIIHQELNLVPGLSITENIFLGRELITSWGWLDRKSMRLATIELLKRVRLNIDPSTPVESLKVGQQQLVEIAKALYGNASVLIMDEPTSAISDKEVSCLFDIIRQLRSEGKVIVYISHKLKELFTIADRFTVLRDGQVIDAGEIADFSEASLIKKMTGRPLQARSTDVAKTGDRLLHVSALQLRDAVQPSRFLLKDISFDLYEREVLGIYGLMGAGRTELMETIFGLHAGNSSGKIEVAGQAVRIHSPSRAIAAGIALVPEDRKTQGLQLDQSIRSNISITILKKLEQWGLMLNAKKEKQLAADYIHRLSIKTSSQVMAAGDLSGGNQQKIVLAKWLATHPRILLLDEPTRGVDVNAKAELYALMRTLAAQGMGIIMVSSEMPEIMGVADRVLVMNEGCITATLPLAGTTEEEILKFAIHKN